MNRNEREGVIGFAQGMNGLTFLLKEMAIPGIQ
jgi:hypothetical protein